jgi:hypothetical protein
MDPYIERPTIWADFHDRLIPAISAALQPRLRPKYAALVQDRLYVVESGRPIRPDVALIESGFQPRGTTAPAAVLELDKPVVFHLSRDEIRQPFVKIVEPAAGNRLVTAIEVLSPDNKTAGAGRKKYTKKREEFWAGGANLVEIDLLRDGKPTLRVKAEQLADLPPWCYLAAVTRWPDRQEIYPIALPSRLPRMRIPLLESDPDVPLDLQEVFTRCWQEGPYPEMLRYDGPPPGTMASDDIAWCESQLVQAGFRPAAK